MDLCPVTIQKRWKNLWFPQEINYKQSLTCWFNADFFSVCQRGSRILPVFTTQKSMGKSMICRSFSKVNPTAGEPTGIFGRETATVLWVWLNLDSALDGDIWWCKIWAIFFPYHSGCSFLGLLKIHLVGGFKHFLFSIIHGIILPIDFPIFQRGWNHQPVMVYPCLSQLFDAHVPILPGGPQRKAHHQRESLRRDTWETEGHIATLWAPRFTEKKHGKIMGRAWGAPVSQGNHGKYGKIMQNPMVCHHCHNVGRG
jgi:hypothetical protein